MKRNPTVGLLAALLVMLGCGPSPEQQQEEAMAAAAQQMEEAAQAAEAGDLGSAMEQFGSAMEQMGDAENRAQPVDRERLRDLLPEEAGGMNRANISSESASAMGFAVSFAEARYEGGDGSVDVKITDMGNYPGVAMMGFGWAMAEMDRESDTGFERTTRYRDHRGYERYDNPSRSGELQVLVAERFHVVGTGNNVEIDQIRGVLDDIDFGALEGMRNEGR